MNGLDQSLNRDESVARMWRMAERLFPMHRTLVGPGFRDSLAIIAEDFPLDVIEIPSGTEVFDWKVPLGFKVNAAYVEAEDGSRPIDFEKHCYHIWNYSQPFDGVLDRDELVEKLATDPNLTDAIPLRITYYLPRWGLSATQEQVRALPPGQYRVHIDTEHFQDFLRIGEAFLPGESGEEILINSYLCHPRGANDNLSGVVVAVELMRLLAQLPTRRFSYRLALWPETIGSIAYIHHNRDRLRKFVGVLPLACCGDAGKFVYKTSYRGDTLFDRAVIHALRHSGYSHEIRPYNPVGGDERQFNTAGVRAPCGLLTRTPANEFPEYHTSRDDLDFIGPAYLGETLDVCWRAVMAMERARVYAPTFVIEPFLSGKGIYPYDQGMGTGERGAVFKSVVQAYFRLIPGVDGVTNLLDIAEGAGLPIEAFDRPVADFLKTGLIVPVMDAGG